MCARYHMFCHLTFVWAPMLPNTNKLSFGNAVQDSLTREQTSFIAFCPGVICVSFAPAFFMQAGTTCPGAHMCTVQSVFHSNQSSSVCLFNSQGSEMFAELQSLPAAIWKALCSSLGAHQHLQTLSLAGSAIGDTTLQVRYSGTTTCVSAHQY